MACPRSTFGILSLKSVELATIYICFYVICVQATTEPPDIDVAKTESITQSEQTTEETSTTIVRTTMKPQNSTEVKHNVIIPQPDNGSVISARTLGKIVTRVGEIYIEVNNDTLTCNSVECPRLSTFCEVYVTTKRHKHKIVTKIKCVGELSRILFSRNSSVPNLGHRELNDFSMTALDGNSWSCSGCTGSTSQEILLNMQREQEIFEAQYHKEMQEKWQQENDKWGEVIQQMQTKQMKKSKKSNRKRRHY